MRGREREWRHIDGLLPTLLRGGGGTPLVDGEPGSGKSRRLSEAAAAASERGPGVVRGSVVRGVVRGCVEELGGLAPYSLFLEALDLQRADPNAVTELITDTLGGSPDAETRTLAAAGDVPDGSTITVGADKGELNVTFYPPRT